VLTVRCRRLRTIPQIFLPFLGGVASAHPWPSRRTGLASVKEYEFAKQLFGGDLQGEPKPEGRTLARARGGAP
jgi:hypothetical protein